MKPLVYISGPYSAETLIEREINILNARKRMIDVVRSNTMWPVCPHTHTAGLEMYMPEVDCIEWLHLDIAMLATCDALWVVMPNDCIGYSSGVSLELAWAMMAGMPIYAEFATPNNETPITEDMFTRQYHIPDCNVKLCHTEFDRYNATVVLPLARDAVRQYVDCGYIPDPSTYKGSWFRRENTA